MQDGFKAVRREGIYVGLAFTATVNIETQIATLQGSHRRAQRAGHRPAVDGDCHDLRCPSARQPAGRPQHVGHSGRDTSRLPSALRFRGQRHRPRRTYQCPRDYRLQSADGRGHQRERHQSPPALPWTLARSRRSPLARPRTARSGPGQACTCSSSASREEINTAARSTLTT